MSHKTVKNFLIYALPLLILVILAGSYFRIFDNYELETLDLRFALKHNPPTTDKVVLVEIGDDTLRSFGKWPLDRSYHAILIKALSEYGAKAIVFDIFFSERREYDDDLEEAIRSAKNVYLPFVFELESEKAAPFASAKDYGAKNLERFSAAARGEGHINIFPDTDGKFRRVPLFVSCEGRWYPYLSFLVGCDYLGIPIEEVKIDPGKYMTLSPRIKIPLDDSSNMIINFSGKWDRAYRHYSYRDIIQSYLAPAAEQKPIIDLNIFRDKVCVIGLTAAGTVDLHPNPLEPLYPGYGIHAEVFNSMLNKRYISRASKEANLVVLILLAAFIAVATLKTRPIKGILILTAVLSLFAAAGAILFGISGLWIDLFYPTLVLAALYLSLTLYKYVTEWKKRLLLENELGIAKKIQESFLPKSVPETEGIDMEAAIFTARQVGGDLYDFRPFGDGRLGVMIGDVSGKGVPASLFMAMVTSEFKFIAAPGSLPEKVLYDLNSKLSKESDSGLFVTMFYMIFDMKKRTAKYSNGGHLPVMHLNKSGELGLLDSPEGTPLGLLDSSYSGKEVRLQEGSVFILYTDGITEAMNSRSEMYGEERLASVIKKYKNLPAKKLLKEIEKDVRSFEPKSRQHDDMAIVVVKIM